MAGADAGEGVRPSLLGGGKYRLWEFFAWSR